MAAERRAAERNCGGRARAPESKWLMMGTPHANCATKPSEPHTITKSQTIAWTDTIGVKAAGKFSILVVEATVQANYAHSITESNTYTESHTQNVPYGRVGAFYLQPGYLEISGDFFISTREANLLDVTGVVRAIRRLEIRDNERVSEHDPEWAAAEIAVEPSSRDRHRVRRPSRSSLPRAATRSITTGRKLREGDRVIVITQRSDARLQTAFERSRLKPEGPFLVDRADIQPPEQFAATTPFRCHLRRRGGRGAAAYFRNATFTLPLKDDYRTQGGETVHAVFVHSMDIGEAGCRGGQPIKLAQRKAGSPPPAGAVEMAGKSDSQ